MIGNLLSSLLHNKARVILMLVLTVITFTLSLITITNSYAIDTQIKTVKEMFKTSLDTTYKVDAINFDDFNTVGNTLNEFKKYINEETSAICGAYDQTGVYFDELLDNKNFIYLNKTAYAGTFRENDPTIAETIFIDTELLSIIKSPLSQEDFNPVVKDNVTYLPMYIGEDFKDIISIGDTLTVSYNNSKYIVKGYLSNETWLSDDDALTMPPVSLNHIFFAPFSQLDKTDNASQESTVGKIFIYNQNNEKSLISNANQKALELGAKLSFNTVNNSISLWLDSSYEIRHINYIFAFSVFICSAITMISVLCVAVLLKKKEYGIKIAFGATKNNIIFSFCFEIILINIIAAVIAFIFTYYTFVSSTMNSFSEILLKTLVSTSLVYLIILALLLVAIVLAIPMFILNKYNPVELIKEEE